MSGAIEMMLSVSIAGIAEAPKHEPGAVAKDKSASLSMRQGILKAGCTAAGV